VIDEPNALRIRAIFRVNLEMGSVGDLNAEMDGRGWVSPQCPTKGSGAGGRPFSRGHLYRILDNVKYIGQIMHKGVPYPSQQSTDHR